MALSRRKKSSWFTLLRGLPRSPHLRPPRCQDCQFAEGCVRGTFKPPYQIFGALAEFVFFREHETLRLSAVEPAVKVPRSPPLLRLASVKSIIASSLVQHFYEAAIAAAPLPVLEDDVVAFNG